MKEQDYVYSLDFVIPSGTTGPTGPRGDAGPALISDIITRYYSSTSVSGSVNIDVDNTSNILLPNNSNCFSLYNDYIVINQPGIYEFFFSGLLTRSNTTDIVSLNLVVGNKDVIPISINSNLTEMSFCQTRVIHCNTNDSILINFQNNGASGTSAQNLYIIVKKFSDFL